MVARPLVVPLVIGLALAGCVGEPAPVAGDEVPVITDPTDFTSPNATAPGSHIHDYWKGRTNVTVLDEGPRQMRASCSGCRDGMRIGTFMPPDGSIVPQGTAWVNVTVIVQDDTGGHPYELWVQTALDGEPRRWGPVQSGETVRVESSKERNDPPHYVLSLWTFELRIPQDQTEFEGSTSLRVDAFRGLPLEPYPPHPDHWQGRTEIELGGDEGGPALTYREEDPTTGGTSYTCYFACLPAFEPDNGTVVPFDTDAVDVTFTFTGAGAPGVTLLYHGANTRQWHAAPPPIVDEPGRLVFRIEPETGEADSPYAPRSLWGFEVWFDESLPYSAWAGTYEATAVARLLPEG